MKPDRKTLEMILESLKVQVREIEALLEKPKVMTRAYFEVCVEFDDKPVAEKEIERVTTEIESALQDAAESCSEVQEHEGDVSIEVSSIDREDKEEAPDDD